MENKLNRLFSNRLLSKVTETLTLRLLHQKNSSFPNVNVDPLELRKAVWLSSILAESENELHKKCVQDFAILIYLNFKEDISILKVVYILFSRIGNLTATKFLTGLYTSSSENPLTQISMFDENIMLTQELIDQRIENLIIINDKPFLVTDFQLRLYHILKTEKFISISAPTSSGKSFILKRYIEEVISSGAESFCVFYIVPSRALINQVTEELRKDIGKITIKNVFIPEQAEEHKKIIYVITPERAVKIVNSEMGIDLADLIFIDEIQNVEHEDERGTLFEFVYEELSKVKTKTKIIIAGPFISNPKDLFNGLFDRQSEIVDTQLSPVFQLKTIIEIETNHLTIVVRNHLGSNYKIENAIEIPGIQKQFSSSNTKALALIVNKLIKSEESNLIYASKGNYAENWAKEFSETFDQVGQLEEDMIDLIKYLRTDIHPQYYLINCLLKRVAFHHSNLSEFVRKEIETLFNKGRIKTLFCTSTLLEGVNLPADNLFILHPQKNRDELSSFEFGNLIGRAGRLKNSLYGTIFCLANGNIEWAERFYDAKYNKEVVPGSFKSIQHISQIDLSSDQPLETGHKANGIISALRFKAIKADGSLEQFLGKKRLAPTQIEEYKQALSKAVKHISIPVEVLRQNPSIDPIIQNILYQRVVNEGFGNWVIHPNKNFNETFTRDQAEKLEYKNKSFYWQLDSLINRLNDIFKITDEVFKKDNLSIYPNAICVNAVNWIQGKSIGELIRNRIKYFSSDPRVPIENRIDPRDDKAINKVIRDVIKINLKVITFSLLKYLKLLSNILESILTEEEKQKFKLSLALPIQLELGTQDPIVILLITSGVPRTIALKVFEQFKKSGGVRNDENILSWLEKRESVPGIEPIYNKFLSRNRFLKERTALLDKPENNE